MRSFLARGPVARSIAFAAVAVAAVVWLAVALAVLRVLVFLVFLLIAGWCVWLAGNVLRRGRAPDGEPEGPRLRVVPAWVPRLLLRLGVQPVSVDGEPHVVAPGADRAAGADLRRREQAVAEREAALVEIRSSVDELLGELLARQERLSEHAEQLQREQASQIEAMKAVVERLAQLEDAATRSARQGCGPTPGAARPEAARHDPQPVDTALRVVPDPAARAGSASSARERDVELELRNARLELEADLRLEDVERREQQLVEREAQLGRRERELAAFVAEAQSRLELREAGLQRPRVSVHGQ